MRFARKGLDGEQIQDRGPIVPRDEKDKRPIEPWTDSSAKTSQAEPPKEMELPASRPGSRRRIEKRGPMIEDGFKTEAEITAKVQQCLDTSDQWENQMKACMAAAKNPPQESKKT